MKKFVLTITLLLAAAILPAGSHAQVYAYTGPGPLPAPAWAPAGYHQVRYYYFPDLYMYYEVPAARFIFLDRGRWIVTRRLPLMYRSYNLFAGPKVMLRYNGPYPYEGFGVHQQRFPRGYCAPNTVYVFPEAAPYGQSPRWRHPGHEYYYEDGYRHEERQNGYDRRAEQEYRRNQPREDDDRYGNHDRRQNPQRPEDDYEYDREDQYRQPERRDTNPGNENPTRWRYKPLGTN